MSSRPRVNFTEGRGVLRALTACFTTVREEVEDEGGIMIPELASDKSQTALTLRELLIEESSKPFKIMRGPLLRVKLVRVSIPRFA